MKNSVVGEKIGGVKNSGEVKNYGEKLREKLGGTKLGGVKTRWSEKLCGGVKN